jgi:hypothetical protein
LSFLLSTGETNFRRKRKCWLYNMHVSSKITLFWIQSAKVQLHIIEHIPITKHFHNNFSHSLIKLSDCLCSFEVQTGELQMFFESPKQRSNTQNTHRKRITDNW